MILFVLFRDQAKHYWLCKQQNDHSVMIDGLWDDLWDENGFQSLFLTALQTDDVPMMEYLAGNPSNITNFNKSGWTATHSVAFAVKLEPKQFGDTLNALKQFFMIQQQQENLSSMSKSGNLPIHLACEGNNYFVLQVMIDNMDKQMKKQLLNQPKSDEYWEYTPLMIAITNNNVECVEILCKYDEIDIVSYKAKYPSFNALQFACWQNKSDILKILLYALWNRKTENVFNEKSIYSLIEIAKKGCKFEGVVQKQINGNSNGVDECDACCALLSELIAIMSHKIEPNLTVSDIGLLLGSTSNTSAALDVGTEENKSNECSICAVKPQFLCKNCSAPFCKSCALTISMRRTDTKSWNAELSAKEISAAVKTS